MLQQFHLKIILFSLGVFCISSVFAQPKSATAAGENTIAPESQKLQMTNAFFQPYRNEWLLTGGIGIMNQAATIDLPAQTITSSGFTYTSPASSASLSNQQIAAQLGIKYGILDRVIAGIQGIYLISETNSSGSTGGLYSTSAPPPPRTGFYNPIFTLIGRLAGINRNEWYFDVKAEYTPGFNTSSTNTTISPQSTYTGAVDVGKSFGSWTAGITSDFSYMPSATRNGATISEMSTVKAGLGVQYDFEKFYARGLVYLAKNLDANSNSDAINKQFRTVIQTQVGTFLARNVVGSLLGHFQLPVSGNYDFGGLKAVIQNGPIFAFTLNVAFRF